MYSLAVKKKTTPGWKGAKEMLFDGGCDSTFDYSSPSRARESPFAKRKFLITVIDDFNYFRLIKSLFHDYDSFHRFTFTLRFCSHRLPGKRDDNRGESALHPQRAR